MTGDNHMKHDGTISVRTTRGRDDQVYLYFDITGRVTVTELVRLVAEHQGHGITINGMAMATRDATPEELAAWKEYDEKNVARALEGRRRHYERLRAEFGDEPVAEALARAVTALESEADENDEGGAHVDAGTYRAAARIVAGEVGEPDSAFCDRGPCWKPRGHDGLCAPGRAGGGDRG